MSKTDHKKKLFKKIVNNILLGLFVLAVAFFAFSLIPIKGNYKIMSVMSGSMDPAIKIGSIVLVKPSSDYQIGDIVTFRPLGSRGYKETTTHRIVGINNDSNVASFTTQGDANNSPDNSQIIKEQILGKVIFHVSILGYLISFVRTLPGLVLIIIIPSTLIIYEEIKKIIKEIKSFKEKRVQALEQEIK